MTKGRDKFFNLFLHYGPGLSRGPWKWELPPIYMMIIFFYVEKKLAFLSGGGGRPNPFSGRVRKECIFLLAPLVLKYGNKNPNIFKIV